MYVGIEGVTYIILKLYPIYHLKTHDFLIFKSILGKLITYKSILVLLNT